MRIFIICTYSAHVNTILYKYVLVIRIFLWYDKREVNNDE